MSLEFLRSLERWHAAVAWAATAAIAFSAWLCVRSSPWRRAAGIVAAVLALGAAGTGLWLHDPYRSRLRQRLFLEAPSLGWLFERKQHLAFAAVLLALSALATQARLSLDPPAAPGARDLRRAAALAWTSSALLALAATIASTIVAQRASF
jgi:hypothetical protein